MKVLLVSDLHFHMWPEFAHKNLKGSSRLWDITVALGQVYDHAIARDIEHVFILGDIFHKRNVVDVTVLNAFNSQIKYAENNCITTHLLVGNHDQPTYEGGKTKNNALDSFNSQFTHVYHTKWYLNLDGAAISLCPYIHDERELASVIKREVEFLRDSTGPGPTYFFGHMGISGAKIIDTDYTIPHPVPAKAFDDLTAAFLGHYHTPQKVTGSKNTHYVGSHVHHTFSDEGQEKGFIELNLDTGKFKRIKTDYPSLNTLHVSSMKELMDGLSDDYFKIYLKDFVLSENELQEVRKVARGFTLLPEATERVANTSKTFSFNSALKDYIKDNERVHRKEIYSKAKELMNVKD